MPRGAGAPALDGNAPTAPSPSPSSAGPPGGGRAAAGAGTGGAGAAGGAGGGEALPVGHGAAVARDPEVERAALEALVARAKEAYPALHSSGRMVFSVGGVTHGHGQCAWACA